MLYAYRNIFIFTLILLTTDAFTQDNIMHRVFITGNVSGFKNLENLEFLKTEVEKSEVPVTVIYAGDLINSFGLLQTPTSIDTSLIKILY